MSVLNNTWQSTNSLINYPINYIDNISLPTNIVTDLSISTSSKCDIYLYSVNCNDKSVNLVFAAYSNNVYIPILELTALKPINITKVYTLTPIPNNNNIYAIGYVTLGACINNLTLSTPFKATKVYSMQRARTLNNAIKYINVNNIKLRGDIKLTSDDNIDVNIANNNIVINYKPSLINAGGNGSSNYIDPNALQTINNVKPNANGEIYLIFSNDFVFSYRNPNE